MEAQVQLQQVSNRPPRHQAERALLEAAEQRVAQLRHDVGVDAIVVCSAMGSSTNQLLAAGDLALDG